MIYEKDIMREARNLARLQAKRRTLLKQLRDVNKDIRTQKRHLRAVVQSVEDWPSSGAAFKTVGNKAGE